MTLRETIRAIIDNELDSAHVLDADILTTRIMAEICEAYFQSVKAVPLSGRSAMPFQRRNQAAEIMSQHRLILSDGSAEKEIYTCKCNSTLLFTEEATYHLHVANQIMQAGLI